MQLSFIFIEALMLKRQLEEEFKNIVRTPATISVTEPRPQPSYGVRCMRPG